MDVDEGGVVRSAGAVTGRAGVVAAVLAHGSRNAKHRGFLSQLGGRHTHIIVVGNLLIVEAPSYLKWFISFRYVTCEVDRLSSEYLLLDFERDNVWDHLN